MNDPLDLPPAMSPASPLLVLAPDEFVSRNALATLVARRSATVDGAIARLPDGSAFLLREAVRVLGSASHDTDPYGFTGKADTLAAFLQRGFVLSAERIALGRFVYDVEYGYLPQRLPRDPDESGVNPVVR